MIKNYPDNYRSLQAMNKKLLDDLLGPMKSLGDLHKETAAEGALDTKS
jgi:hypothetical protein